MTDSHIYICLKGGYFTDSHVTSEKLNKIAAKKQLKVNNLFESAYDLFENKGVFETTIDDIVKKAGVAKGTFYLYFKNKYDIIDRLILTKTIGLFKDAVNATYTKGFKDYEEAVYFFLDYIIEYLKVNKRLLRFIHKNLSWGMFRMALASYEQCEEMKKIKDVLKDIKKDNIDANFDENLFMIIELTGSVCYSTIIYEEPVGIDEMKPALFKMIKKMIS